MTNTLNIGDKVNVDQNGRILDIYLDEIRLDAQVGLYVIPLGINYIEAGKVVYRYDPIKYLPKEYDDMTKDELLTTTLGHLSDKLNSIKTV